SGTTPRRYLPPPKWPKWYACPWPRCGTGGTSVSMDRSPSNLAAESCTAASMLNDSSQTPMARNKREVKLPPRLPELGTPAQVAKYLHTTVNSLARKRYVGNRPRFIKVGHKVLYRWSDVLDWLEQNTVQRTADL